MKGINVRHRRVFNRNKIARWFQSRVAASAVLSVLALGGPAFALGDGPRAYQLVPAGSQILSFGYIKQDGNSLTNPGATVTGVLGSVDVGYLQYVRTFELAGQQAAAFVVLPSGNLNGSLALNASPIFS